jgi:hypothetical protein
LEAKKWMCGECQLSRKVPLACAAAEVGLRNTLLYGNLDWAGVLMSDVIPRLEVPIRKREYAPWRRCR